eukprot:jgi/Orpsp1_1/1186014/evm.model.c7180000096449.1
MCAKFFNSSKYNFIRDIFDCEYNDLTIPKIDNYDKNENKRCFMKHNSFIINDTDFKKLNEFFNQNELDSKYFFISVYGYIMSEYSGQNTIYTSLMQIDSNFNNKNLNENFDNAQPLIINFNAVNSLNEVYKNLENIFYNYKNEDISFKDLKKELNLINSNNVIIYEIYNKNINTKCSLLEDLDINLKNNNTNTYDIIFKINEDSDSYKFDIYYIEDKYDEYIINNILK